MGQPWLLLLEVELMETSAVTSPNPVVKVTMASIIGSGINGN